MDPEDGDDAGHLVLKTRLSSLVTNPTHLARLEDGVRRVHAITEAAYSFGHLRYLSVFDARVAAAGGVFSREVAAQLASDFPLDHDTFKDWTDVVSSKLEGRVGRPYGEEARARMTALHAFYDAQAAVGRLPVDKTPATNLSYLLQHACNGMMVAYRNNVVAHYNQYVLRFVKTHVTISTILSSPTAYNVEQLSAEEKAQLKQDVSQVRVRLAANKAYTRGWRKLTCAARHSRSLAPSSTTSTRCRAGPNGRNGSWSKRPC